MIDLLFYFLCDESLYFALFHLSILSIFFDLVRDDMGAGPRKTCGKWSGVTVFCFPGLTCAGCFVWILDDLVKGVPKVRHGFVFCGHREDLFDLAVENVRQGEKFLKTLVLEYRREWVSAKIQKKKEKATYGSNL